MDRPRCTLHRARRWTPVAIIAFLCGACAAHAPVTPTSRVDEALRPGATPLEVARAFYTALHAGDAAAAGRLVASANAARVADAFVGLAGAYQRLEDALRAAYGDEAAQGIGYRERVEAEDEAMARAAQSIEGDQALITMGGQMLATLRRTGGGWRIVLDDALTTDAGVAAIRREAAAARAASERVVPAIRHRLFGSPEDALEAFRNEVTARMRDEGDDVPAPASGDQPPVAL